MALARVNYAPPLTAHLVAEGLLARDPFRLADIGCSGGIEPCWRAFEPALVAAGADPLVEECERLALAEPNADVRYLPRWVRLPGYRGQVLPEDQWLAQQQQGSAGNSQTYHRSSSVRAAELLAFDSNQYFSSGSAQVTLADESCTLDEFVREQGWPQADFVKVDTDGNDYEVLLGGPETLADAGVLGLAVEVQLHGIAHEHGNTFANIDGLLRAWGYTLFDLDVYRYSRAALPDRFSYDLIAQTGRGQAAFGEALYLWDACHPAAARRRQATPDTRLVKLLCLFELFGLEDCAAELVLAERARFAALFDTTAALDVLAKAWWPEAADYGEVLAAFETDPRAFHRSGAYAGDRPPGPDLPPVEATPDAEQQPAPPAGLVRAASALDRWTGDVFGNGRRWP